MKSYTCLLIDLGVCRFASSPTASCRTNPVAALAGARPTPDTVLTLAEAAQLHRQALASGQQPMWIVMTDDPAFPHRYVGRVHTADHHGGVWLPGALVASTLEALVVMMPAGLTRYPRASVDPLGVVETWD